MQCKKRQEQQKQGYQPSGEVQRVFTPDSPNEKPQSLTLSPILQLPPSLAAFTKQAEQSSLGFSPGIPARRISLRFSRWDQDSPPWPPV